MKIGDTLVISAPQLCRVLNQGRQDWICPHCQGVVREGTLLRHPNGVWYHKPCYQSGPVEVDFPTSNVGMDPNLVKDVDPVKHRVPRNRAEVAK